MIRYRDLKILTRFKDNKDLESLYVKAYLCHAKGIGSFKKVYSTSKRILMAQINLCLS